MVRYIEFDPFPKPAITEQGKADFKQLKRFERVKKGQELVSKLPPTEGKPEKTVTGKTVTITGEDIALPKGKNTTESGDGLTLISEMDGYAFYKSGDIYVDDVYHISGNVDYSTGNIKFDGTIVIEGDVRSGFRVDATDSIYIYGSVGAADIYSQKGDILVQFGIIGKGKSKILAGGSLRSGFVQDATVRVKKDVFVEHYVINSIISAGGKVMLSQNEGLIRGGKIYSDCCLEAIEVGSSQDIATEIGLSGDGKDEVYLERLDIEKEIERLQLKILAVNKRIDFLKLLKDRLPAISESKEVELVQSGEELSDLKNRLKEARKQEKRLSEHSESLKEIKSIIVKGSLHRGVTVTIDYHQYFTEKTFQSVRIYRRDDDIKIESLNKI